MEFENTVRDLLAAEVRRRLVVEGLNRIRKCLGELTVEEIWWRPNAHSNSMGNLVLHLCGNVRQWILTGLAGQPEVRKRQAEFDETGPIPREELLARLEAVLQEVEVFLEKMPAAILTKPVTIQGYSETGLTVLVHVVEHFSYHVGQITYFTKWKKNLDTGYYDGVDLEVNA